MTDSTLSNRMPIPSAVLGHAAAGAGMVFAGYVLAFLVQFDWLLGSWSTPFVLMVVVAVMVMVLLTVRREEGRLPFGRAFGLSLLAGWLARMGYNLFNVVFFQLLRPDLRSAYGDLVAEKSMEAFSLFGIDPEDMGGTGDMEAMLHERAIETLSLGGQALDALVALLWVALVALIVSVILQRPSSVSEGKAD